jgi:hypothetical protein
MRDEGSFVAGHAEAETLVTCLRCCRHPNAATAIGHAWLKKVDENGLLDLARRHKVLPLLDQSLHQAGAAGLSTPTRQLLDDQIQTLRTRNTHMALELIRLLDLLQQRGVRVVPFKGPVQAAALYGDLSLRQFADLDILVPLQQVLKARDILVSAGYKPDTKLAGSALSHYLRERHHFCLVGTENQIPIELHWRFVQECYACPLEKGAFWKRLVPLSFEGTTVPGLPAEEWLILLCLHGAKHNWQTLGLVCDLDALLRARPNLDWDCLGLLATALGARRMINLGLILARNLLGARLPPEVGQRASRDSTSQLLARQITAGLLGRIPDMPSSAYQWVFYLQTRERWHDRVEACLRLMRVLSRHLARPGGIRLLFRQAGSKEWLLPA